jgi:hypothetical protein
MIIIGFVIFAVAVAAAIVAIVQNQSAMVEVHGLGYNWNVHVYWLLVAGLVIAGVGWLGASMMRTGAAHAARMRIERRGLVRENARLSDLAADRSAAPTAVPVVPATAMTPAPAMVDRTVDDDRAMPDAEAAPRHRHLFHRTSQV